MSRLVLLFLAGLAGPASALAQSAAPATTAPAPPREAAKERESGRIVPFLEGTEVHSPFIHNLVFEAAIRPHLVFFQNYGDSLVASNAITEDEKQRSWWRRAFTNVAITGTPAVVLRMSQAVSKPVKTPSYMPRLQVQKLYVRLGNKRQALEELAQPVPAADRARNLEEIARPLSLFEAHLSIVHFSNGQKGCAVVGQVRAAGDTDECEPEGITGQLNFEDGSFSTNYIRSGVNYRRVYMRATESPAPGGLAAPTALEAEDNPVAAEATSELTLRLDFDRHLHSARLSTPTIRGEYGKYRFRGMASFATARFCSKRSMATLEGVYNPDPPFQGDTKMSAFTGAVTVSCFPLKRGDWGGFVRYYRGQDYYNIHYRETLDRWQVGITHTQDGFFRLFRR